MQACALSRACRLDRFHSQGTVELVSNLSLSPPEVPTALFDNDFDGLVKKNFTGLKNEASHILLRCHGFVTGRAVLKRHSRCTVWHPSSLRPLTHVHLVCACFLQIIDVVLTRSPQRRLEATKEKNHRIHGQGHARQAWGFAQRTRQTAECSRELRIYLEQ